MTRSERKPAQKRHRYILSRTSYLKKSKVTLESMKAVGDDIEKMGNGQPKLRTTILVRADRDVPYGKIQRLMQTCQDLGFYKFALRATPAKGAP